MNKWIIFFIIAIIIVMALLAWALGLFGGGGAVLSPLSPHNFQPLNALDICTQGNYTKVI